MTLGALIDLGVPLQWLKENLSRLPLTDFDIKVTPVDRSGIHATAVHVEATDDKKSRNFSDIQSLIDGCPLSDNVKSTSLRVFKKLAEAEASVHNCSPQEVHFHEVGGIDAIVDIVGTALGLEYLEIKKIVASKIPLGKGFVSCRHGNLPVPAPATVGILKDVPVYGTDIPHELVTPTGAAIIVTLAEKFSPLPEMIIKKVGYGAGKRELDTRPNLLRIIMGEGASSATGLTDELQEDQISILEASIDDMNPELFGYLMDRLFAAGALDVYWIPIYMKKNRPGTMLQVLCKSDNRDLLINHILSETTSLGVRYYESRRRLLWRDQIEIKTSYGNLTVKRIKDPKGNFRFIPEYEVCQKIAREQNLPLKVVYETVAREAAENE